MKRILFSIALTVITAVSANAQLKEGHASYKIDMSTDNPEMEMAIQMMQGSTLELYFSDDKSRTEMSMGSMMKITTITDAGSEEVLMLMSGMMGNKAVKSNLSDLEEEAGEQPEYNVELTDEMKEIQGYKCKKAILTDEEGNEMIFWYTEEIEVNKKGQTYLNENVPGFPLEFEVSQGDMMMIMTSTGFEKKIKNIGDQFDMSIPEGYEEMTREQLQSMGM